MAELSNWRRYLLPALAAGLRAQHLTRLTMASDELLPGGLQAHIGVLRVCRDINKAARAHRQRHNGRDEVALFVVAQLIDTDGPERLLLIAALALTKYHLFGHGARLTILFARGRESLEF